MNAVNYNGRAHPHLEKAKLVATGLEDITERVVVMPYVQSASMDLAGIPHAQTFESFLALGGDCDSEATIDFAQLPFGHPLFIMFSSGTTGKPKSIVHSAGGTLLQHTKEHLIHGNMNRSFFSAFDIHSMHLIFALCTSVCLV